MSQILATEEMPVLGHKYNKSNLTIIIPKEYKGYPVVAIKNEAFKKETRIKSVNISDNISVIGYEAFSECKSLTNIEIPTSVDTIRDCAFKGCTSLTSIVIPINVEYMGSYVFNNCTNLTVYCVAPGKPDKWDDDWGGNVNKIVWYYKNNK